MLENLKPLFTDVTWGAGGSTADLSLQLALRAHNTGHVGKFFDFVFMCIVIPCVSHIIHMFILPFSQYAFDMYQHGKGW
jgi:hypothetical protein